MLYTSFATVLVLTTMANGQGFLPLGKLRKGTPEAMYGQSNDVYEEMERSKKVSQIPDGMAILYASAPIFSPTSKDPEGASEVYQILPEAEAVQQGVDSRRLLEDALIEMGFPLEELTEYRNGRVRKIYSKRTDGQAEDESPAGKPTDNAEAILAALAGPLPYIRRGAWGRK
ncbi:Uncharacterized protein APZ42_014614 [Daphnia magna]|uniref:Uncharacterized protein n=2 Tax=Daphnia magna TaxID=35525 RepID=A0A162PRM5_9CRUS|nr:hypothetical protein OUZ56_025105 [Daphnia magna]KZS19088.1 Uncharacterized protein APZ42_014614 [Daphnia magna]